MKTKRRKRFLLPALALAMLLIGLLGGMHRTESLRGVPASLQGLYRRNPEARDFVRGYRGHEEDPVIDLSGEVTPGEAPLLLQWDSRWGYRTYNQNFMARAGCGPTCLSMAAIALTHDPSYDPWASAYCASVHGS